MNNFLSMEDLEYLSDYNKKCNSPRKKQNFFNYTSNTIYREYDKQNNDIFIATDKYYISEKNEDSITEYIGFNFSKDYSYNGGKHIKNIYLPFINNFFETITQCDDTELFISHDAYRTFNDDNSSYINKKYIDLVIVNNISFSLDEIKVNKRDIIQKTIMNDILIHDKLLEKLYFNDNFSKNISIKLPEKYNKLVFDNTINNKYLFKINFTELPLNYNNEINIF